MQFLSPHGVYLSRKPKQIHCGVPQQGLAFVRSNDVIYGGLSFNIIYVETSTLGISGGSDRHTRRPLLEGETQNLVDEELKSVFWQLS